MLNNLERLRTNAVRTTIFSIVQKVPMTLLENLVPFNYKKLHFRRFHSGNEGQIFESSD